MDDLPPELPLAPRKTLWSSINREKIGRVIWAWARRGWGWISGLGIIDLQWISRHAAGIWHNISTLDTAKDVYTLFGGDAEILMSFISNPLFGICLIILGFVGIPAAKREASGEIITPVGRPFGWILFVFFGILVFSTLWFETYMFNMFSSGGTAMREFYIAQHTPRKLTENQRILIHLNVCRFAEEFQPIQVLSVPTTEAMHYGQEFINEFKACQISVQMANGVPQLFPIQTETADLDRKGLFVAVMDKNAPDARSKAFLEHLQSAGIEVKFSQFEVPSPPQAPVTLFISDR